MRRSGLSEAPDTLSSSRERSGKDGSERVMITHDDLAWWLETAARLDWIWATTYAETAPHSYVLDGRTTELTRDDFVRAARVIHTFGRPAKFYGMTNIYLTSENGRYKWWTMDKEAAETGLINRATTDRLYGVQNAPITESGITTSYDSVATGYDTTKPPSPALAEALRDAVDQLRGPHLPAILDVGCGTGRVLDLGLTTPERYAGVDPSTPMLNQLIRKHPGVGAVYPTTDRGCLKRRPVHPRPIRGRHSSPSSVRSHRQRDSCRTTRNREPRHHHRDRRNAGADPCLTS